MYTAISSSIVSREMSGIRVLCIDQRKHRLLDIAVTNVTVLEAHQLGPRLFLRQLQDGLHHLGARDQEAEDRFFAHAEEHAVSLIECQNALLVVLRDQLSVFLQGLRVETRSFIGDILDQLPGSDLGLRVVGLDVVALEDILEIEHIVRVFLGVLLLLLLSFLFHFADLLVSGEVQVGWLVFKHDVSGPGDHLEHIRVVEVLDDSEPLEGVAAVHQLDLGLVVRSLLVQCELQLNLVAVVGHVNKPIV